MEVYWFVVVFGIVFMFQVVLNDFKLQGVYCVNDFLVVIFFGEKLCYVFIYQLYQFFIKLFVFKGIGVIDKVELFWGEVWDVFEVQYFVFGEGIVNFKVVVIVEAYYVVGIGFFQNGFFGCYEVCGVREFYFVVLLYVQVVGIMFEVAGVDLQESDMVLVIRVYIGVDFEYKICKFIFVWFDFLFFCDLFQGWRCYFYKVIEEFMYVKVVDG